LDTFASGVATAATNFDAAIQTAPYDAKRALLISNMNTINDQRTLENSNLTTIRTYSTTLAENNAYVALADDEDLRKLIINTSQNADFKSYFENYADRELNDNPIYHNALSDSSNEQIIDSVMRLKGLPDVTDYVDLDSVARKALKDTRLKTKLKDAGKTTEQIIDRACELLAINVDNKDIYAKSKSLLSNMNANDREIVKTELDLHNQVNTLS